MSVKLGVEGSLVRDLPEVLCCVLKQYTLLHVAVVKWYFLIQILIEHSVKTLDTGLHCMFICPAKGPDGFGVKWTEQLLSLCYNRFPNSFGYNKYVIAHLVF